MAGIKEIIEYIAKLNVKDYIKGQKKMKEKTEETNDEIQKGNKKNKKSFKDLSNTMKTLVKTGGIAVLLVALKKLVDIGKASLAVYAKQDVAFRGLAKVAEAYGQSVDEAMIASKSLSEDGLVPLTASIQTIKNLISTGFSVAEAMQIAESFKQIGAFNNVVGDLGQAMIDSSKGIKTNSIELIENIGLTERLSTTMEKANVSTKKGINLADSSAQRRAFLNSVVEQSNKFQGSSIELTDTLQGSTMQLKTALNELGAEMGESLTPNMIETNNMLIELIRNTRDYYKINNEINKLHEDQASGYKEIAEEAKKAGETIEEYNPVKIGARTSRDALKQLQNVINVLNSRKLVDVERITRIQDIIDGFREKSVLKEQKYIDVVSKNRRSFIEKAVEEEKKLEYKRDALNNIRITNRYNANETIAKNEREFREEQLEKQKAQNESILQNIKGQHSQVQNLIDQNLAQQAEAESFVEDQKQANFEREIALQGQNEQKRMEFLESAHFKREALRQDEIKAEEEAKKKVAENEKKYAQISRTITSQVLAGKIKGIDDLKEVILKEVQADALGKTIQLGTTGIVEGVLSLASYASGNAAAGKVHGDASALAFAGIPQVAAIAGLATGALGGIGGEGGGTATEDNNQTVTNAQAVEQQAEQTQSITYEIPDDSVLAEMLLPKLDQASQDGYNIRLISKR